MSKLLSVISLITWVILLSGCGGDDSGQTCTTKYRTEIITTYTSTEQSVNYSGSVLINTDSSCGEHLQLGIPKESNQLLCRDAFALGYNYNNKIADWVSYSITDISVNGYYPRSDNFVSDKDLPEYARADSDDYSNSGYDRGHLAPAATIDYSEHSMQQSFLMSNVVPQNSTLNRGLWAKIEEWVRDCAIEKQNLQIYTGTITNTNSATINDSVKVPDYLYKIIVKLESPAQSIAFLVPNEAPSSSDFKQYITNIEKIESMTNSSFLDNLSGDIASRLRNMTSEICEIDNYEGSVITTEHETIKTPYEDCSGSGTCCKVCKTGKACGDSCISKSKTCHQSSGCACNG